MINKGNKIKEELEFKKEPAQDAVKSKGEVNSKSSESDEHGVKYKKIELKPG